MAFLQPQALFLSLTYHSLRLGLPAAHFLGSDICPPPAAPFTSSPFPPHCVMLDYFLEDCFCQLRALQLSVQAGRRTGASTIARSSPPLAISGCSPCSHIRHCLPSSSSASLLLLSCVSLLPLGHLSPPASGLLPPECPQHSNRDSSS